MELMKRLRYLLCNTLIDSHIVIILYICSMNFSDWLNNEILAGGFICAEYAERVRGAKSKKELFDICCDTNGLRFIPEMSSKGHPLSYGAIIKEFGSYINGRYVFRKEDTDGHQGYSSAIYCQYRGGIVVDVNGICLLACNCSIYLNPYTFNYIVVDQSSDARIYTAEGSETMVIKYTGANVRVFGEHPETVKIKEG